MRPFTFYTAPGSRLIKYANAAFSYIHHRWVSATLDNGGEICTTFLTLGWQMHTDWGSSHDHSRQFTPSMPTTLSSTSGSKLDLHYSLEHSLCFRFSQMRYRWNPWNQLEFNATILDLTNSRKSWSYHKFRPLFTELGGDDLQTEPHERYFFQFRRMIFQFNFIGSWEPHPQDQCLFSGIHKGSDVNSWRPEADFHVHSNTSREQECVSAIFFWISIRTHKIIKCMFFLFKTPPQAFY